MRFRLVNEFKFFSVIVLNAQIEPFFFQESQLPVHFVTGFENTKCQQVNPRDASSKG